MNYPSPHTPGSTPGHEWDHPRMTSATPTPSPMHNWYESSKRPATRAGHTRVHSYSQHSTFSPRPPKDSPRYNSYGEYATATVDVSPKRSSSTRKASGPSQRQSHHHSKRERRNSHTYARASTPYGESDEDEFFEVMGRTYVLPSQARTRCRDGCNCTLQPQPVYDVYELDGAWYTNYQGYQPGSPYYVSPSGFSSREASYDSPPPPRPQPPPSRPPTSNTRARRSSTSVPQRPQTVRPTATAYRARPTPLQKAGPLDPAMLQLKREKMARKLDVPPGYSLKNWDPEEEPILLLGSVFDANSLGKWIYDWTVYREGPASPIADIAGDLWLLLIQYSGKIRRAEDILSRAGRAQDRLQVQEFLESSDRIGERLRSLLKTCESPMLKAASRRKSGLGKNSGVEFVDTLFGRDRQLVSTERLMQNLRNFNTRFDEAYGKVPDKPIV